MLTGITPVKSLLTIIIKSGKKGGFVGLHEGQLIVSSMTTTEPKENYAYSRVEISAMLGGNIRSFLPHKDGRVVAGCFSREWGPHAPREILVGETSGVQQAAEMLCGQKEPIPVFLQELKGWVYVGMYRVGHWTQDPTVLDAYAKEGHREDHLSRVMFMICN
jgi:hypothetical protein